VDRTARTRGLNQGRILVPWPSLHLTSPTQHSRCLSRSTHIDPGGYINCAREAQAQCDRKTHGSMATNYRYYTRLIRRIVSTPPFQIVSLCFFLILGVRWVTRHNHDDASAYAPVGRPVRSVENQRIDWSKLYYAQIVMSPEYLCNALMVWHQIEEIGSRAQRQVYSS